MRILALCAAELALVKSTPISFGGLISTLAALVPFIRISLVSQGPVLRTVHFQAFSTCDVEDDSDPFYRVYRSLIGGLFCLPPPDELC